MIKEDDLNEFLKKEFDQNLVPNLSNFIKIDNISREYDQNWETNGKQKEAATYLLNWFNSQQIEGTKIEILEEKGRTPCILVIKEPKEFTKTVLLYGHIDKQPPLTDQWSEGLGPYTPVIKGERLYGRGSSDDGYAFFLTTLVLKALVKNNFLNTKIVLYFESDEESGSKDLVYFLDKNKEKVGIPNLVVCLDSGTTDYEHFSSTTTLRGYLAFTLKVSVLKQTIHSGNASGIIADSFRIGREIIDRFEEQNYGTLSKQFYKEIPKDKYQQAEQVVSEMGPDMFKSFPLLEGVQLMSDDNLTLYLNNVWRPQCTLIGMDGVPDVSNSGNVLRKSTSFRLSIRTPPSMTHEEAEEALKKSFEGIHARYNAKVELLDISSGSGFNAKPFEEESLKLFQKKAMEIFGKQLMFMGVGGSIPFMPELGKIYPNSQFLVTGVVTADSNIHAPDENLHLPFAKKLLIIIANILKDYK